MVYAKLGREMRKKDIRKLLRKKVVFSQHALIEPFTFADFTDAIVLSH